MFERPTQSIRGLLLERKVLSSRLLKRRCTTKSSSYFLLWSGDALMMTVLERDCPTVTVG
jgi:hypothetical protein